MEDLCRFTDRMSGIATRNQGGGDGNSKLWEQQAIALLRHVIELIKISEIVQWPPTLKQIFDVLASVGVSFQQVASKEWKEGTPCGKALMMAQAKAKAGQLSLTEVAAYNQCVGYFMEQLPGYGDRFVGSVLGTAQAGLLPWVFPPFLGVFSSGQTNTPPELVLDGKILVLDWPVVKGINCAVAQAAIVQCVQQTCLQRPPGMDRPVGIYRDECQYLIAPDEWETRTLSISRGAKLGHWDLSQHAPGLERSFNGAGAEKAMEAFVSSHAAILLFAQNDLSTNQRFSTLFGSGRTKLFNVSQNPNQQQNAWDQVFGTDHQVGFSVNEQVFPHVPPEAFGALKRGGPPDFQVEAYLYQAGKKFGDRVYKKITFNQVI